MSATQQTVIFKLDRAQNVPPAAVITELDCDPHVFFAYARTIREILIWSQGKLCDHYSCPSSRNGQDHGHRTLQEKGKCLHNEIGLVEGPDVEPQLSQTLKDDSTVVRSKQCWSQGFPRKADQGNGGQWVRGKRVSKARVWLQGGSCVPSPES